MGQVKILPPEEVTSKYGISRNRAYPYPSGITPRTLYYPNHIHSLGRSSHTELSV
ncbi:hypothetical protein [Aerosakkonema funiforme]|uniref:hypothetical protein n=1 Tax=Aerosakkonema funiforme TaxID=1246630 RepID=UPI0035BA8339